MTNDMKIGVFWDYENCCPPAGVPGYVVTEQIRKFAHHFGIITVFKAYLELSSTNVTPKILSLRTELQSSGVSLTDCPRNGRKDVADKMILCDLLAFALDNPAPAAVMLISGDRDFNYAISLLRHRRYTVILVIPPQGAHITLRSQADVVLDWKHDIFALEGKDDKEGYGNPSSAVGGVNGISSLGAIGETSGFTASSGIPFGATSFQSSSIGRAGGARSHSRSTSFASGSPTPSPAFPVMNGISVPIPSPSTEIPLQAPTTTLPETPPQQNGTLPAFGVTDWLTDASPASTAIHSSPAKSQVGTSRRRGSTAIPARTTSPTKDSSASSGADNEEIFSTMIEILEHWRLLGNSRPLRSQLGMELKQKNPWVYTGAGVKNFSEYIGLAEKAGIVVLGSSGITGQDWIQLHKKYQGKVFPLYI